MSATVGPGVPQAFADAVIAGVVLLSQESYGAAVKTVQVSEIITQITAVAREAAGGQGLSPGRVSELIEQVQVGLGCLEADTVTGTVLLGETLGPVVAAEVVVPGQELTPDLVVEVVERVVVDELRLAGGHCLGVGRRGGGS